MPSITTTLGTKKHDTFKPISLYFIASLTKLKKLMQPNNQEKCPKYCLVKSTATSQFYSNNDNNDIIKLKNQKTYKFGRN